MLYIKGKIKPKQRKNKIFFIFYLNHHSVQGKTNLNLKKKKQKTKLNLKQSPSTDLLESVFL